MPPCSDQRLAVGPTFLPGSGAPDPKAPERPWPCPELAPQRTAVHGFAPTPPGPGRSGSSGRDPLRGISATAGRAPGGSPRARLSSQATSTSSPPVPAGTRPQPSRRPAMQTSAATAYRVRTRTRRAPRAAPRATCGARDPLGRYIGTDGRPRELVAIDGQAGSVLVIDRDAITLADRRLVAHIAADEPASNASLICRLYLADETGRRCRPVVPDDLERMAGEEHDPDGALPQEPPARDPTDLLGRVYRIAPCALRGERPEMRWVRRQGGSTEVLSLREVVGLDPELRTSPRSHARGHRCFRVGSRRRGGQAAGRAGAAGGEPNRPEPRLARSRAACSPREKASA